MIRIVCVLNRVWLFGILWTVALQAPLSMEFSRQENWNGLPFSTPGDLPDLGIEPTSPTLTGRFFTTSTTWEDEIFYKFSLLPSTFLNICPLFSPATLQWHQYWPEEGVCMAVSGREVGRTRGGRGRFLITPVCTIVLVAVDLCVNAKVRLSLVISLGSVHWLFCSHGESVSGPSASTSTRAGGKAEW